MLVVKKFGGTSVADKERIMNVANRCAEEYHKGNDVIVVLSAMGKQTDRLLEMAHDINPKPSKRELDMLLTTGEQTSVALMSMAFAALNIPAVSLTGFQVPMHTTTNYGNARLKKIETERVEYEISNRKIVIITGFQGINKYDDYTTLGRGGSDTTAVALAAVLGAEKCEIFTDVDGVYTADPRVVKDASKLSRITYDEMLELASLGAGVLHNRAVEMAKRYNVQLIVRSSLNENEGTIVKEEIVMEKMLVSGVACDKDVAQIAVVGLEDQPGVAFSLFRHLANHHVNVDMILQSVGRNGTKDISFTVTADMADTAVETVKRHGNSSLKCQEIKVENDVAKVSIVGAGMITNPGVAASMFEALYDVNVNIKQISTSEIRVTVLIDQQHVNTAMNAIHSKFELEN